MKITFPMLDSSLIAFFWLLLLLLLLETHLIACLLAHWGVDTTQAHVQTQNFLCFSDFNLGCLWPPPELSNYFGTDDKLGPVALSIRREKLEDTKDLKDQYQYRLIVRTSEVCVCVCLCVYMLITGVSSQSLLITQLLSVSPGLPVTRALIITFPLSPRPSAHPSSALCQWKIPPAQSKHIKAKPNTGCSHSQLLLLFDGSDTHDVVNDGLMIVEN